MTRFLFLLCLGLSSGSFAQNLVPNSGFEKTRIPSYSMMDSGHEFASVMRFWETPNLASTDLISPKFRTPKFKPIPAHSGENMAGLVIHGDFWSEYLRVPLKDTIRAGAEYYIEFWMAYCRDYHKDDTPRHLNPYFGALLDERFFIKTNNVIEKKPQVFSTESIELKPNQWVKINGRFIPDKDATHLYIGQFFDKKANNPLLLGYYYIDDVRVERFTDISTIFTPKESAPDGLDNIYFETDKYDLLAPSYATLDRVVEYLKRNPSLTIQINGHTDNEGEFYHNQELSNNRAKTVHQYLSANGIATNRLSFNGFGASQPIATNNTEIGRQENRRVEFLASNALVSNTSLDQVNVAESDLSYAFSGNKKKMTPTEMQKIGKYKLWSCNKDGKPKTPNKKAQKQLSAYAPKSAKEFILKQSAAQALVLFNDSQEHPQTRAFFMSMLQDFYDQGFRQIGMEALGYLDPKLNERGYPSINSGDRSDEPIYGELIRVAQRIGFEVFPYEAKASELEKAKRIVIKNDVLSKDPHNIRLSAKYWAQAMNINRQLQRRPNTKTLIYAHRQNIREQDFEGVRYVGAWLKKFTTINPLTIEQGMMNERCFDNEYPLYYTAKVKEATVFARNDKVLVKTEKDTYSNTEITAYDIQVYHPRTTYQDKRPTWANTFGDKHIHKVNLDKYDMKRPCLLMAYHAAEDPEIAIPADVVEAKGANRYPSLLLPSGDYILVLRDKEKRKKLDIVVH